MGLIFLRFLCQKPAKSVFFLDISLVSDGKMVPNHTTTMVTAVWLVDKKPLGIKTKRPAHFFHPAITSTNFSLPLTPNFKTKNKGKKV